jgi:DNA polymerase elongation subunit (family B)
MTEPNNIFPRQPAPVLIPDEEDLMFQVIDWYIPEADRAADHYRRLEGYPPMTGSPDEYKIFMYGVTKTGHSVCVKVNNFCPYFFLKIPPAWDNLSDRQLKEYVKTLASALKYEQSTKKKFNKMTREWEEYTSNIIPYKLRDHLEYVKIVKRKNFWYFTNGQEFPFIKIRVKSLALFNILKRHFGEPAQIEAGFAMYESNIDPFLRFIHERNIEPCGWVKLPRECYDFLEDGDDGPISRANYNVNVDYTDVHACNINQIAPLLIVSFDIECTSSHGDFPVAKKNYRKLAADLLSTARTFKQPNDITKELVTQWILDAFEKPIKITLEVTINQVFPKEQLKREVLSKLVTRNIAQITDLLKTAAVNSKGITQNDDDDDDDEEPVKTTATKKKEDSTNEENLIKFLDKNLPELCGDSIIQIGTTVNRYGSDEIIYKHIVTLKSCKSIPGVDVESYDTEEEVLNAWKELLARLDPDILIGYNIFGFDMQYIWQRAEELCIDEEFAVGLGRMNNRRTILDKKELSSSALGDNIMYIFDMDGVVLIDLLKVMQRDHKLDSYKLDAVAKHFLKDSKEDLKPKEIFEKFLGSSQDRCDIATYCIQDCALCNRLMHKLKVLENNVGMGNVCSVPLSYLFMRGQGIKIFSLVSKECRAKQYLIPVLKSTYSYAAKEKIDGADDAPVEEDGYEGAIVLPPEEGMYLDDPITVLDYSSLYPSSMISRNLSHDSYVADLNSPYAHLQSEGITYHTITYDVYEGKGDAKHVVGKKECTFAQFPNGKKGIIPSILMKLLQQRKNTRKKIEYETITLSNGTTLTGLINEESTSIIDVDAGETTKINSEDIVSRVDTFNQFEKAVLDALQLAFKVTANSLYGQIGSRMSQIYLKDIAACTTATGREMIMTAKGFVEKQYNARVIYGDSVMPDTPIMIRDRNTGIISIKAIKDLATVWQSYAVFKDTEDISNESTDMDTECNVLPTSNTNRTEKEQSMNSAYEVWTDRGWSSIIRVIRHKCNKRIYRVVDSNGIVDVTEDHSLLDMNRNLIKPETLQEKPGVKEHTTTLLHAIPKQEELSQLTPLSFPLELKPVYDSINDSIHVLNEYDFVTAQQIYMHLISKGYYVKLDHLYGGVKIHYSLQPFEYSKRYVYVHLVNYNNFVYDIETEEGVFQAGIGSLIVKNTDSIFCKFPVTNEQGEPVYGREALPLCIAAGQKASKEIKSILPPPQCLEYEKTMWPFILLSKKRYVGNLYETDAEKKPKQKSMGIVLKRRDNANIVKIIYGGIIDILLNNNDFEGSVNFLKTELQKMVDGNVELINLIVSKTLKGNYKDPTKIAHRVLASRMGERDEGNMPMVNDRVPYVYIKSADGTIPKLQGDRIEHPDYIREMNLKPDYLFYITNQLIKPISQLYALCVEKLPGYSYPPSYWIQWDEELCGKELYTNDRKRKDRIQALKMKEVESLLFYPYMIQIDPELVKTKSRATRTPAKKIKKGDNVKEDMPEIELTEGSKIIEIRIKQLVKGKKSKYESIIHIYEYVPNTNDTAKTSKKTKATKEIEEKQALKELKLELNGLKHAVLVQSTEKAFQLLIKEFPDMKGIPIQIRIDKTFIKTLKKAYQEADSIQEELQKASSEQDVAKLVELQELQQTANILGYFQIFPFIFDPI